MEGGVEREMRGSQCFLCYFIVAGWGAASLVVLDDVDGVVAYLQLRLRSAQKRLFC
jgi:hypothetical protein